MSNTPVNALGKKITLRSGTNVGGKSDAGDLSELIALVKQLTKRIDVIENNITAAIDTKIKDAVSTINNKIDDLNNKINKVEKSLNEKILNQSDALDKKIEASLVLVDTKISSVSTEFAQSCDDINNKIKIISSADVNINDVDDRVTDLERLSHNCDLIVRGIPRNEHDLLTVFDHISKAIGCSLNSTSIGAIFWLPSNNIMVKFLTMSTKQLFFSKYIKCRNLNLTHIGYQINSRVYINECLCKHTTMLLRIANTMRKDGWIHRTYTKNGFLYIRKSANGSEIKISNKNQLLSGNTSGLKPTDQAT